MFRVETVKGLLSEGHTAPYEGKSIENRTFIGTTQLFRVKILVCFNYCLTSLEGKRNVYVWDWSSFVRWRTLPIGLFVIESECEFML